MNIKDLKKDWMGQNSGNGGQVDLVIKLFRESRKDKIHFNINKITLFTVIFMIYNILVLSQAVKDLIFNYMTPGISIASILLIVLSFIAMIMNISSLSDIGKIDFSLPIISQQKIIERLKIKRIRHNRFIFVFAHLYSWLLFSMVFDFNIEIALQTIWENTPVYVFIQIGLLIFYFPFSIWLLRKYDSIDDSSSMFWQKLKKDSFLTDQSVNSSLNNIQGFLNELNSFEKE